MKENIKKLKPSIVPEDAKITEIGALSNGVWETIPCNLEVKKGELFSICFNPPSIVKVEQRDS